MIKCLHNLFFWRWAVKQPPNTGDVNIYLECSKCRKRRVVLSESLYQPINIDWLNGNDGTAEDLDNWDRPNIPDRYLPEGIDEEKVTR